jgi:hypothetical protein
MTLGARPMTAARAAVLAVVPDAPEWVEARAIAADDAAWAIPSAGSGGKGWVIGSDAARLMIAVGSVKAGEAIEALAAGDEDGWTLLAAIERDDVVAAAETAGHGAARAAIHTLPAAARDALPALEGAALLGADDSLDEIPRPLAEELRIAIARGRPVWAVRVDGVPASFAYAPWRSEAWFDVSVDTLQRFRQLGLGTVVASAMIRGERELGREPVWGSDEANAASMRLAARLGFVRVAGLWVIA